MKLSYQRMNKDNFEMYGEYISEISNTNEIDSDYSYYRDIFHFDSGKLSTGILYVNPHKPEYSSLERHVNTEEMLVVLSGSGVILFGKSGEGRDLSLNALYVKEGDAFVMGHGIWHGLLSPINCDRVKMLVVFKQGTEDNDVEIQHLQETVYIEK